MVLAHSLDFGQNTAAEAALQSGVALVDSSAGGRLELTGADCRQFLHNQTTNAIAALQPGQGCETVFVTSRSEHQAAVKFRNLS